MSDKKHTGRGFGGKGYYIALILCATAIGISGYLYYRNANRKQSTTLGNQTATTPGGQSQVAALATQPQGTQPSGAANTTAPTAGNPTKTALPVSGDTVAEYAMDCLSYNATTRDWRVHDGMDISAAAGTPVLAAADGEVYTVYTDDTMGRTVVIRHDGDYTTKYASLAEEISVEPGDKVTIGQEIGVVGSTALLESALGEHVHFTVLHQDTPVDPQEFLNLG